MKSKKAQVTVEQKTPSGPIFIWCNAELVMTLSNKGTDKVRDEVIKIDKSLSGAGIRATMRLNLGPGCRDPYEDYDKPF